MDNPEKLAQDEEKQDTTQLCVGHHHKQTTTNNTNKTCSLLQTTGGKDEPNIVFYCVTFTSFRLIIIIDYFDQ